MNPLLYVLLAVGAFVSVLNFYLSFVRVPLLQHLHPEQTVIRNVSGFPVVGSAALWLSMVFLPHASTLFVAAVVVSLLDTGGIHWFLAVMAVQRFRGEA